MAYPYGLAAAEREQGEVLKALGRLDRALERFAASLHICRRVGNHQCVADNLVMIGQTLEELGRTETATQVLEEALDRDAYLRGSEHGEVLRLLEMMYSRQRRLGDAIAKFRAARDRSQSS